MRAIDLCYLDASVLATKLRTREVSSEEVVRTYLERVGAINPYQRHRDRGRECDRAGRPLDRPVAEAKQDERLAEAFYQDQLG